MKRPHFIVVGAISALLGVPVAAAGTATPAVADQNLVSLQQYSQPARMNAVAASPSVIVLPKKTSARYHSSAHRSLAALPPLPAMQSVGADPRFAQIPTASRQAATELVSALRRRPDVETAYVEPVLTEAAPTRPSDIYYPVQQNLHPARYGINLLPAWQYSRGRGVTIAIVDSGIVGHPDLTPKVARGYDFISRPTAACDGNGWDGDPKDVGSESSTRWCKPAGSNSSSIWHGTHVAGIAAALTNNLIGVAGVAPDARIQPVRVSSHGWARESDVAAGIAWAAGLPVKGAPVNRTPARVINISLEGRSSCTPLLRQAIAGAIRRGAVVVAPAGNAPRGGAIDMTNRVMPASCKGVIAVGGSHIPSGLASSMSNYGAGVAVAAPVNEVWSTWDSGRGSSYGPDYARMSGTSVASPHVAGVAALLLAKYPKWTPAQVKQRIMATTHPFAKRPSRPMGTGILDAGKALAAR